jgi:hypothetical protein
LESKFLRVFRKGEAYSILGLTELKENNNKPLQRRTGILTISVKEKIFIQHGHEIKFRIQNSF